MITTMPVITDQMIDKFRRTGKRRASYVKGRDSRLVSNDSRVVPQQTECRGPEDNGKPCGPRGVGTCSNGLCIL